MADARQDGNVQLSIRDDGRGCSQLAKGNGLNGIQSRINELRGALAFPSARNGGFVLAMTVPIKEGQTL